MSSGSVRGENDCEPAEGVSPLEKARLARLAKAESGDLERLDPMEKARRNPKSRKLAIVAKCWDCCGGNADPGVRKRIGDCRSVKCPLHPLRPYQHNAETEEVAEEA